MSFQQRKILVSTASFATPYADGDNVGGLIEVSPAPTTGGAGYKFQCDCLVDESNVGPDLNIVWFSSRPTGTYTDNAPVVFSDADKKLIVGVWDIDAADWITIASTKLVDYSALQKIMGAIPLNPAQPTIYGSVVARSAWTATAKQQLNIALGFEDTPGN